MVGTKRAASSRYPRETFVHGGHCAINVVLSEIIVITFVYKIIIVQYYACASTYARRSYFVPAIGGTAGRCAVILIIVVFQSA